MRVIKDEKHLKRLIKLNDKYPISPRERSILLTNGFTNRFADEIKNSLSRYKLENAYLALNSNQHKEKVIDEIVVEVEKIVDKFKAELDSLDFN